MKETIALVKSTFKHWQASNPARLGAALSYYAIFSIAPLLVLLIAITGLFFGHDLAQGRLIDTVGSTLGSDTASYLRDLVVKASEPKDGIIALVIGFFTLLFGALGVFGELGNSLNEIWHIPPRPPEKKKKRGWKKVVEKIKNKAHIALLIPLLGVLLMVSILSSIILQTFGDAFKDIVPGIVTLLKVLEPVVSFILLTALFYTVFRVLPRVKLARRVILLGALMTALLFILGEFLIGLYLDNVASTSVFGSAGSAIAILLFVYYSSQIFFIGASFTYMFAKRK